MPMAKRITAIFNDFSSAENATYQVGKEGLPVKDLSIYHKSMDTEEHNYDTEYIAGFGATDSMMLGYSTSQLPGTGFVPAYGIMLGDIGTTRLGNTSISEELLDRYAAEVNEGCVIWTVKVDDDTSQVICDILDRCGAIRIDRD
jgi:hypothetical protein